MGAGPAGLTVGCVLRAAGMDCVVPETGTREFVGRRPWAGVIEEPVVRGLERQGLAGALLERARRDTACEFRFDGGRHPFGYRELAGHHHWVYPQQFLVTDLVREYADVHGGAVRCGVRVVRRHDLDGDRPPVSYVCPESGRREAVACDVVAGCDRARGDQGGRRRAGPGAAARLRHRPARPPRRGAARC
ncbi:FAD-dependent monooxygenase [Streptomyces althioticus]|uniref:FAD-dependent monooxygenase n=1 Tax=Streptomyces althioticus TaxID=83380 RepID=UPI00374CC7B4